MPKIPFEVDPPTPPAQTSQTPHTPQTPQTPASSYSETADSPADSTPGTLPKPWKVSQLTRHIRLTLEGQFRLVTLEAELSNFKRAASGHLYFSLKDDRSQIRGVMFRMAASALRFAPTDGLEVIVRGHVSVYEPRGEYQLQVSSMEPKGVGALQLAFEQLKKKLHQEGLFEEQHKQALPFLPRCIGIVTSSKGAAIHDMINVLQRRCPTVSVLLYPTAVQGEQAAPELIEGIRYLNDIRESHHIDVMIVGRGGGSMEDLWAFNDETLARTIFASQIPIISGVGHEVDFTIADFVSDLRAPTPSAAMELAVPKLEDLLATVRYHEQRLHLGIKTYLRQFQERVTATSQRLRSPDFTVHQHSQRVDELSRRLHHLLKSHLATSQQRTTAFTEKLTVLNPAKTLPMVRKNLTMLEDRLERTIRLQLDQSREHLRQQMELLDSVSPLTVMNRGYGIVLDQNQQMVRSVDAVHVGDPLEVRLKDGVVQTEVIDTQPLPSSVETKAETPDTESDGKHIGG